MRDVQLWAYDTVSGTWKKYLVDADGHSQVDVLSQPDVAQTDPTKLKHLPHGYYAAGPSYLPLAVDSAGKQLITLSSLAHLDDIDDVSVAAPTDGYVLYWDAATSLWKCKLISTTKIVDADADTKVDVEESADEDKIRMDVKGVEAFLLDDIGVLTLAKQSGFRAYRTVAQSITNATWTKVQYNTEEYDIQGEYDHVTNFRFTATKAGRYLVTAICGLDSMADGKIVTLVAVRNGDTVTWVGARRLVTTTTGAAAGLNFSGSGIMNLAAAAYIEIWIYHTDTAARNTPAEAMSVSFEVIKVG